MLSTALLELSEKNISVSEARQSIESVLASASSEEFLAFMFDPAAESARRFIDSILNEYDGKHRKRILKEMARSVPQKHMEFFLHAFSRRTPEDDLLP